ncbi:hypothetical protein [Thermoleptolyngbya sp.]
MSSSGYFKFAASILSISKTLKAIALQHQLQEEGRSLKVDKL